MSLTRIEEWFAVRVNHEDQEFWPGRLIYDPNEGISLSSINFSDPSQWYSNETFQSDTITGYLDYQKPATIISPFIQGAFPGTLGSGLAIRSKYNIIGNGLILNYHLASLDTKCFSGLRVQMPSFHAWSAPHLVRTDYNPTEGMPALSISIAEPNRIKFKTPTGECEITNYASAGSSLGATPISENTRLSIDLAVPDTYEQIMRLGTTIDIVFAFMIGVRLEAAAYYLPITEKDSSSGKDVVAEARIVPAWKRGPYAPHRHQRLFTQHNSPVSTEKLINYCLQPSEDIIYFMDIVLSAEGGDLKTDDCFIELLGCFEDFDKRYFGSGSDPAFRIARKKLRGIIMEHGDDADLAACDRIGNAFRNEFPLWRRLERLIDMWRGDGFRGNPDIKRIVEIRNIKPHGRGRDLSTAVFREMITYLPFLCALARYQILKKLDFTAASIAEGFSRMSHRYGMFVPESAIPDRKS